MPSVTRIHLSACTLCAKANLLKIRMFGRSHSQRHRVLEKASICIVIYRFKCVQQGSMSSAGQVLCWEQTTHDAWVPVVTDNLNK
jgi:hypothetical protein